MNYRRMKKRKRDISIIYGIWDIHYRLAYDWAYSNFRKRISPAVGCFSYRFWRGTAQRTNSCDGAISMDRQLATVHNHSIDWI